MELCIAEEHGRPDHRSAPFQNANDRVRTVAILEDTAGPSIPPLGPPTIGAPI